VSTLRITSTTNTFCVTLRHGILICKGRKPKKVGYLKKKSSMFPKLIGWFQDYLVSPKLYQAPFLTTTPTASEESSMHPCTQYSKVVILHAKTAVMQLIS
jgi:hypothetical protein